MHYNRCLARLLSGRPWCWSAGRRLVWLMPFVAAIVGMGQRSFGVDDRGSDDSCVSPADSSSAEIHLDAALKRPPNTIRIATFNVSLFGSCANDIVARLRSSHDSQAQAIAAIVQCVRPDILLLNELDYDPNGEVVGLLQANYLSVPQSSIISDGGPTVGLTYEHFFTATVNTGRASGHDLDRDGQVGGELGTPGYGGDAWGYGRFPGQYGMAVLSRFPLDREKIRTFQQFRWADMPGALLPLRTGPAGESVGWYSDEALRDFPLSSKSHWDLPLRVDGRVLHLLVSHPTPPVFDGPEDRNGRRNHDEIRFWADYIAGDHERSRYIYDDQGQMGGLTAREPFVICGDLNADPCDAGGERRPILQLLQHAEVQGEKLVPRSPGGLEQARNQGGVNLGHRGDSAADTGDWKDGHSGPGNLRLDYVLPSKQLNIVNSGVFWPKESDPLFWLVGKGHPVVSSDHRLVWVDVSWEP